MENLIPVINKLQDVFNTLGSDPIDLPQIAVVGSQSSGKSSVLENVVGKDFLPRGSGIVTRRPLVLQLIYMPSDGNSEDIDETWGEFLHKPNEMFHDFNEIRNEIAKETDRLTGQNKGISSHPINLKIYSPNVVNLTMIDLPGITRVPVGDQPPDIEEQIRSMILTFISKPSCIILAVTAANTDLANSDALQMAKEVDPTGSRTLGVLTKIDLMDKGTDAIDMLTGKVIPLQLGFIGVINRSQEDIAARTPITVAHKREEEFFKNHPRYRTLASKSGTPYLAKTLNKILVSHIKDALPELKIQVNKMLSDAQAEMETYGDALYSGSKGGLLLQMITNFCSHYRDAIDGKLTELSVNELYGGARINYIFNDVFYQCLHGIDPLDGLTMNDIRTTIRNATGPRAALFIPEASFELLVKRQITRLEEPSLQCVELVFDELQRIVAQVEDQELMRFTILREKVVEVVNNLLHNYREPTKLMIANLINIEMAFINTNHPDFVGGDGAISSILERLVEQKKMKEQSQHQEIKEQQKTIQEIHKKQAQQNQPLPAQPRQLEQPKQQPAGRQQAAAQNAQQNQKPAGFLDTFWGKGKQDAQNQHSQPQPSQPADRSSASSQYKQQAQQAELQRQQEQHRAQEAQKQQAQRQNLSQVPESIHGGIDISDKEKFESELISNLLISYFDIVRKNVGDTVPKTIMHFLVNESKNKLQNQLVATLYKEDLFDELLEENPTVAARRRQCSELISILTKAHEIINEVRDFNVVLR